MDRGFLTKRRFGHYFPSPGAKNGRETDRGFRGIGRLSGLAFAESVAFLTRAEGKQPVTRIVWDGPKAPQQHQ